MMGCRKISELCNAIIDCPHSTPKWQKEGGKRVIRNFNLRNGHLDFSDGYFVEEETFKNRISRGKPEEGDIVFSREAPMGVASIIPGDIECCLGQRLVLLKVNREICSPEYLNYCISSDFVQKQINRKNGVGSIVSNLTIPEIKELIIPFIPLADQIKLVTPIVNLDRKISLNRSINAELERMAKEIYDYWFVQFEFPDEHGRPYKSSGGAMVYNPVLKREVPEGWEVKRLSSVCDIFNGATPSTKDESNYGGDIIWITPKDLSDQKSKFTFHGERNITQKGFSSCSTHMLPKGTILMSSRAPIGLVSIASNELCTNQGFKNLVPKEIIDNAYLYYYIKMHIKQIEQLGTGTTFKEVSREDLVKFPILYISNRNLYKKWYSFVKPIFDKQAMLCQEIEELTNQRDELLPLLMTGQVEVK